MEEVLIETAPFSLVDNLWKALLGSALVAFIVVAAVAWKCRGKKSDEDEPDAVIWWLALTAVLFIFSGIALAGVYMSGMERHVIADGDYSPYGVYEGTVERVTLTDFTIRTDYGAVLTIPYGMGWIDGGVDEGDRVALDVSRMRLNEKQGIIRRGGDDMDVMFLTDDACVSRFDSRDARVPNGVECHRAFGDTEYKGSVLLGGDGTYYVLTGVSRL